MIMNEEIRPEDKERLESEESRNHRNPFLFHNHIHVGKVENDYAEMYVDIEPDSINSIGVVHGGLYFTMGDTAAGTAARTDGRGYITQNANVHYLRSAKSGRITAKAHVLRRGRTGALMEVRVTEEDGTLCFYGTYYFYCTGVLRQEK